MSVLSLSPLRLGRRLSLRTGLHLSLRVDLRLPLDEISRSCLQILDSTLQPTACTSTHVCNTAL